MTPEKSALIERRTEVALGWLTLIGAAWVVTYESTWLMAVLSKQLTWTNGIISIAAGLSFRSRQ